MNEPEHTRKYDKPPSFEAQDKTTDQVDPSTIGEDVASAGVPPIFGDYELIEEIARGGMGVVYKARQKSLNRIVALKMIKSGEFSNQEQVDRFYKEAEAAANLDHPGIVPVYEVGEVNGQHYFTMGFVDGDSLAEQLRHGPLPPNKAARYAKFIAEAVTFAHSKGVIHRDLKPGNVLITKEGTLRITDFGLAKRIEEDSELTAAGQVLGTPSYMPPEQAEGRLSEVGPAADVYAIGATLYCMLVGRPPFQAANLIETLQQVVGTEPPSLQTLNHIIAVDLDTLCLKCLEKKPSNRYESAAELVAELGRFLNGEPIEARPIGRMERAARWCKRKPAQAIAIGAVLAMAVGGPAFSLQLILANRKAAFSRVDTLLNASPATIPLLLSDLDEEFNTVRTRLKQLDAQDLETGQRLRVSLALLPRDHAQLEYLKRVIRRCSYEELAVALARMKQQGGDYIASDLWERFRSEESTPEDRFRVGLALATLDSDSDRWNGSDYEFLVTTTLQEITVYQPSIRQALKPIADQLIEPITIAFDRSDDKTVREAAALAIVDFTGKDFSLLTDLAIRADAKQFSILYPEVEKHAAIDNTIVDKLIRVTKLQPASELNESQRVALGKRRAGAAICLLRAGYVELVLEVLRVREDPESLTQFVHGCRERGVTVTDLLKTLSHATTVNERYGLLLALGGFSLDAIPSDIRTTWVEHVKQLYANDPSSGIHGASGWLLREWGFTGEARAIEEREVPYSENREWFTLKINLGGPFEFEKNVYFTFVVFPAGEYRIGSPEYETDRVSGERLQDVRITRPFAVLEREVTRGEYQSLTGFSGYTNERPWQSEPTNVMSSATWYMAVDFCRQLSGRMGTTEDDQAYMNPMDYKAQRETSRSPVIPNPPKNWPLDLDAEGFRLPTKAEWEIACRGGSYTTYGFGSNRAMLGHYCWYQATSKLQGHRPCALRPNFRGLFDMHGNLYEWCHDWSAESDQSIDPVGPREGVHRILRGGGWYGDASYSRSSYYRNSEPTNTAYNIGFRVTLSLDVSSSHPR